VYGIMLAAAFHVSGLAYLVSVVFPPATAQLAVIFLVLVMFMSGGMSPTLKEIHALGGAPWAATWLSYVRWTIEAYFTTETRLLSDAYKFPITFYGSIQDDSALLYLGRYLFQEGFDVTTWTLSGEFKSINQLDIPILLANGLFSRALAFATLCVWNRNKMGQRSPVQAVSEPVLMWADRALFGFNTWLGSLKCMQRLAARCSAASAAASLAPRPQHAHGVAAARHHSHAAPSAAARMPAQPQRPNKNDGAAAHGPRPGDVLAVNAMNALWRHVLRGMPPLESFPVPLPAPVLG
jgi:hypothetical protein